MRISPNPNDLVVRLVVLGPPCSSEASLLLAARGMLKLKDQPFLNNRLNEKSVLYDLTTASFCQQSFYQGEIINILITLSEQLFLARCIGSTVLLISTFFDTIT